MLALVRVALATWAIASVPWTARPESGDGPDENVVTEADLLASVGPDHPALAALHERVGVAEAGVLAASALGQPALSLAREDPSGGGVRGVEQLDLTVAWELPRRSRRTATEAARMRFAAARADAGDQELLLRRELRAIFARWAVAAENARILAEHEERLAGLAARERLRAERGEVAAIAARRLELATGEAAARRALAEAEAESARRRVAGWNAELAAGRPRLPALPAPPAPAGATGPHPRLLALEQELEAARLDRQAAHRFDVLPELLTGWQRQDDGVSELDGPLLGLSWRVPLTDGNRAARADAEARVAGTAARLELQRRAMEAEREAAATALLTLRDAAAAAEAAAAAVTPLLEGTVAAFQLGESELTELLDVLRSATEAALRAVELREAALDADRRLHYLTK
ncbi:MAG TPA: TolC family protein [Thermoanaerobaculia bacterium]|nr:TolC family protein [Thermoanaerobaculia bacterium]